MQVTISVNTFYYGLQIQVLLPIRGNAATESPFVKQEKQSWKKAPSCRDPL